jgi:hypothetical protein
MHKQLTMKLPLEMCNKVNKTVPSSLHCIIACSDHTLFSSDSQTYVRVNKVHVDVVHSHT